MNKVFLFFIATTLSATIVAQPAPATPAYEPGVPDSTYKSEHVLEEEEQADIEFLEWSRDLVFDYVESLNDGVDSFFMAGFSDEELVNDESSGSNGRLFFTTRREEGDDVNFQVGFNLKLVLPRTRDRLKLLVETDENEDGQNETDVLGTTENITYSTAIRVEVHDGRRWKSSLDNGVRWEGEPVYFTRLRTRRTDYFEYWRSRVLHSVYWRTDIEWGTLIEMGVMRPLDLTRHLSFGFNADYVVSEDVAQLESKVAIFDELSYRSAMLYQLLITGDTDRLAKVNDYVFSITYRRKIYKNFVFMSVKPEVAYARIRDYESVPAINFTFEMILGPND